MHPLRLYMQRHNLSAAALAKLAGCGRMTVFRLLAGKNCQIRTLDRLSAATGLSREELLPRRASTHPPLGPDEELRRLKETLSGEGSFGQHVLEKALGTR